MQFLHGALQLNINENLSGKKKDCKHIYRAISASFAGVKISLEKSG